MVALLVAPSRDSHKTNTEKLDGYPISSSPLSRTRLKSLSKISGVGLLADLAYSFLGHLWDNGAKTDQYSATVIWGRKAIFDGPPHVAVRGLPGGTKLPAVAVRRPAFTRWLRRLQERSDIRGRLPVDLRR